MKTEKKKPRAYRDQSARVQVSWPFPVSLLGGVRVQHWIVYAKGEMGITFVYFQVCPLFAIEQVCVVGRVLADCRNIVSFASPLPPPQSLPFEIVPFVSGLPVEHFRMIHLGVTLAATWLQRSLYKHLPGCCSGVL